MKLQQIDIDVAKNMQGFPLVNNMIISKLSDPPYYTCMPNPFLQQFIEKHGTFYDEKNDSYHREPFAFDVSEGKNDPLYNAHSYHTKVPYKAIMRYILHYTNPGDIIFDGFCGSGMTGVAAQLCGNVDAATKEAISHEMPYAEWGERKSILNDLSPEACFIAYNYNTPVDIQLFQETAEKIIKECRQECGWVYKTDHFGDISLGYGEINYTVWSDVFICPNCGEELILWDISVLDSGDVLSKPKCTHCGVDINKNKSERASYLYTDSNTNAVICEAKQVPVKIFYTYNKKRFSKKIDINDRLLIEKIQNLTIPYWYPTDELPIGYNTEQPKRSHNFHKVNQLYTRRNLYVLSKCYDLINQTQNTRIRNMLLFWFSSIYSRSHKCNRYMPNHNRHVGPLSGTLYIPYFQAEINILNLLEDKLASVLSLAQINSNGFITNQSAVALDNIPDNCIDYIFTDPPFGDNLNYSELNFIWESWLQCKTNNITEAVVNKIQNKALPEYQDLMTKCFTEFYRILKPNRWITVEFHNSKNAVWNSIHESLRKSGFIVADIKILDKQKFTTKQLSMASSTKQDLVISAFKPVSSFNEKIFSLKDNEESVWKFVSEYLKHLNIVVINNGKIQPIQEREAFLLYDRMIAYHIVNGLSVPLDAPEFYKGLDERYIRRDSMYFLVDQVNEYDAARINTEFESIQFKIFISDEQSAISWLYKELETPQLYSEIQPKFLKERNETKLDKIPELKQLLEETFIQDNEGKWYIPDATKAGDIAKLREKRLLKDFEEYLKGKGKLKVFRTEAIRAGFAKLWKQKDYASIIKVANRLPEQIIQEDDKLLMYYDISLSRVE